MARLADPPCPLFQTGEHFQQGGTLCRQGVVVNGPAMTPTHRLLLAALALVLVSSLAVAALWPTSPDRPAAAVVAEAPAAAQAPIAAEGAVAAQAVAPSSSGIFPKVLHR